MNYFLSDLEAATSPFNSSTRASTSSGPLVLGMNNGDVSMDSGEEKDEEEGVVHWQASQTSTILESLLRSKSTGKGKQNKPKSGVTSDHSNSLNDSANSSFSFDFGANASGSNATAPFSSNAARNPASRSRPSAVGGSARRVVSTPITFSSSTKVPSSSHATATPHIDLIADFPKIVKQATSQLDETLKQKTSTLSRSNSGNGLCFDGAEKPQCSRKPLSTSNAHAKPRRASPLHATRPRGMERVVSESTIGTSGSGREHRVGGDVKGKGRVREASDLSSSNACGPSAFGAGLYRDPKRTKLDSADGRQGELEREKGRRDMPPPALPPERVARQLAPVKAPPIVSSSISTVPPVVKTRTMANEKQAVKDVHGPAQSHTKPTSRAVSRSTPQHQYPPPSQLQPAASRGQGSASAIPLNTPAQAQPAPQTHTRAQSVTGTTTNNGYLVRPAHAPNAVQASASAQPRAHAPSQGPAAVPPASQAAPRPSQASRYPPALGMRRVNTFSSSGSQKAYGSFAFASQNTAGASSGTQGYRSAYAGTTELPTKQKAFRPPLKPRTTSTLPLLEKCDFGKGEPEKDASSTQYTAAPKPPSNAVGEQPDATTPASDAAIISAFWGKSQGMTRTGSAGSVSTPGHESLSASTSTTSSDTLSSRGETPPPSAAYRSGLAAGKVTAIARPVTPPCPPPARSPPRLRPSPPRPLMTTPTKTKAFAKATEIKVPPRNMEEEEDVYDDPNDGSFGDCTWDLDIDTVPGEDIMLLQ